MTDSYQIMAATTPDQIAQVAGLFRAYAAWLAEDHGISLQFQGIDEELATLPGKYAPPQGGLWLAFDADGTPIGCAALRPFDATTAEMKRLYVTPAGRGSGLGKALAERTIDAAGQAGYTRMLLDTGPFMHAAQALYDRLGFRDVPPYYDNPYPGCRYMARDL
jgi:GNAT superfamily N-acetyltransferase